VIAIAEYTRMGRIVEPALPEQPRPDDIALVLHTSGTTELSSLSSLAKFTSKSR